MHVSSYGMYGYALLCCETLRDVTQLAVKYHRLATPTVGDVVPRGRRRGGVVVRRRSSGLDPTTRFTASWSSSSSASTQTLARDMLRAGVQAERAARALPGAGAPLRCTASIRLQAEFGQPVNELRFAAALLDQPPTYRNPITVAMVGRGLRAPARGSAPRAGVARAASTAC